MDLETTQPQVENVAPPQAEEYVAASVDTTANAETEQQPQFELEVKYNKETKKLTREEAIELAQKGMNYDKVHTKAEEAQKKLQELEDSELIKAAKLLAEDMGSSIADVGKLLIKQRTDRNNAKREAEIAKEKNVTPEVARMMREAEEQTVQAKTEAQTYKEKVTQYEQEKEIQTAVKQEVEAFRQAHPDVDETALADDPEFQELWLPGVPLEKAYQIYSKIQAGKELERKLNEMSQQQEVEKANAANAEASTGALGSGATVEKPLTIEEINKMTPEQIDRNLEKIAEVYFKS